MGSAILRIRDLVFPLSPSGNARYLVDSGGSPWLIAGRTIWFITSLSVSDYQSLVDDCVTRGYNTIEFHVINHDPRGNNEPFSGLGDLPFTLKLSGGAWSGSLSYGNINNDAPDFSTPNEVFWLFVDGLLSYCRLKGVLVMMFPAYVGYDAEQGWMDEMVANGTTKMQAYGAFIATRYKDFVNICWMLGGDRGTGSHGFTQGQIDVEQAMLTGMNSVGSQQSLHFSAEWEQDSIATDQATFGSVMTLNGAYSHTNVTATQGRRAYSFSSPTKPSFLLEEPYDESGPDGLNYNGAATQPVRRFIWWGWLTTIGGAIAGNSYVWQLNAGWQSHLNTVNTQCMTVLWAFIRSITWHLLVPSGLAGSATIVTAGGGSSDSQTNYVAAAATPDGALMVAYVPPAHTGSVTIAMSIMRGTTRARWLDPTNGNYTLDSTGLSNSGTHAFTPPGTNSLGDADWALVLDA